MSIREEQNIPHALAKAMHSRQVVRSIELSANYPRNWDKFEVSEVNGGRDLSRLYFRGGNLFSIKVFFCWVRDQTDLSANVEIIKLIKSTGGREIKQLVNTE